MKTTVTFEDKKKKAIELMEELGIYKPYIRGFKQDDTICYFEQYAGFWAYQDEELMKKIKEFEARTGNLVYAVTHEYLEFGECYDFLIIPNYKSDWKYLISPSGKGFAVYAFVWNKDDDSCSEYGTIGIRSFGGGIKRFA